MTRGKRVPIGTAERLFGEKYLGADIYDDAFGFRPNIPDLPEFWDYETLERLAELGHILIYNSDRLPDGKPFDLQEIAFRLFQDDGNIIARRQDGSIRDRFLSKTQFDRNGKISPTACFMKVPNTIAVRAGWQIVSPLIACETRGLNAVERFDWLVENMWWMYPSDGGRFNVRAEATGEWNKVKSECQTLMTEERYHEVAERLSQLRLNRYIAEPFANAVLRFILYYKRTGRKLFSPEQTSSCKYLPGGKFISFGMGRGKNAFGESSERNSGSMICCCGVDGRNEGAGVVVSRMGF